MHDPKTQAFQIYLGPKRTRNGRYRSPLITIWHNDPETDGTDDSCGWSFPKITADEERWLHIVAKEQYKLLFARTVALIENQSYAGICYDQDTYGVIYWIWRHFNRTVGKAVWQYGIQLSNKELQYIYELATNPVDNFQHNVITNVKDFESFIYLVYRCWKKYKRKWYQHPRWHIHHWQIQIHPLQYLVRRFWTKCCICGKRGFNEPACSDWHGTKVWHQSCDGTTKEPIPTYQSETGKLRKL